MTAIIEQFTHLTPENTDYMVRLAVAGLLSLLIGIEREIHGRAAGVRTSILVGIGSALFMILSMVVASSGRISDPGRIAAQIVSGIGFLGAGAILKFGVNIRGLTTAACMWIVASVGMAAGAGLYVLAVCVTVMTLFCLISFNFILRIFPMHSYRTLYVEKRNNADFAGIIKLIKRNTKLQSVDFELNYDSNSYVLKANIRMFNVGATDKIFHKLSIELRDKIKDINTIKWYR